MGQVKLLGQRELSGPGHHIKIDPEPQISGVYNVYIDQWEIISKVATYFHDFFLNISLLFLHPTLSDYSVCIISQ